ncbi:MAG: hypothetical protein RLY58_2242 [Pseudomonadota bacterium]|jgi:hypothetical protein
MTRIFDANQALNQRKAQTVAGHAVTGLEIRRDPITNAQYLYGWSWEPEANHCGCMGPQRWNLDGSARANEATSDLMTSTSKKNG